MKRNLKSVIWYIDFTCNLSIQSSYYVCYFLEMYEVLIFKEKIVSDWKYVYNTTVGKLTLWHRGIAFDRQIGLFRDEP